MSLNGKTVDSATETVVTNTNDFFPDIPLQDFISIYRLPSEYDEAPLVFEIRKAIREVNEELWDFVLVLQSVVAVSTLEDFEATLVDDYKAAVMNWARSGLIKYFETVGRKAAAEIQGERNEVIVNEWKSDALAAIDYIGKQILSVAEANGALPGKRKYADGFRATLL